jgi:pilus assembly protein CpaC
MRFIGAALALAFLLVAADRLPRAEAAPTIVGPSSTHIDLETGKGRLIRLDHPASSVFIANPEIADIQVKSPSLVYIIGKAAGETSLFAVGDKDQVLLNAQIVVRHDLARLESALRELVPDGTVGVSTVNNSLVLSGIVFSAAKADDIRRIAAHFVPDKSQLINNVEVDAPNQVNLRVRIAEISRQTIKALGFNWENVFGPGNFLLGLATGNPVLQAGALLAPGKAAQVAIPQIQNPAGTLPFLTRTNGVDNLVAGYQGGRTDLNVLIDALDKQGLVTVLAEPNLTALSGQTASFLAGGEFPVPVPGENNTTTIQFKKFGVSLAFQATIGARDLISLKVKPEVSELSSAGAITLNSISVPALTTRRAETTIELGSGQSFAIAGLLQNNVTHDLQKFPWLGDVPVLGQLFRSDRFQRDESELVIIVTPYIVRPVSSKRLMAPTDGYQAPSDAERLISGASYRPQLVNRATPPLARSGSTLLGPVGFDLD